MSEGTHEVQNGDGSTERVSCAEFQRYVESSSWYARALAAEKRAEEAEKENKRLREALRQIDREARSKNAPLIVTTDGTPTGRSEHRSWTFGTIGMRQVRIRKIARAALAPVRSQAGE